MAGKGKAVGAAIKYGPIVYEASRRYGPKVWDQVKSQREPAERYVQGKVDKGNQHKKAVQHADTVIDGSTLQVFYNNTAHWIVFSGEEPVGVHPRTSASYSLLLKNANLSKRIRPEDEPTAVQKLKAKRRKQKSTSPGRTRGKPSRQHARADVTVRKGPAAARPEETDPPTPAQRPTA